jgi:eukaryotic-like serine/threonine-protein kinase
MSKTTTTPPPPLPPAVLVQRYRLERRLAQGGMAEVWLGTDLSLSRQVAIKLLKSNLANDAVVAERFRREAIAVAQLNHPNIVAVYDAIEDGGRQAVVMQLVNGKSLRQLLDEQKKLSPELTIHIGTCVAGALDAAHQAGMVHRDVKPGNILITPDGRVLLTDFGIAKGLEPAGDDLTNDNIMMGTAKYLSPEQVRGKRLDGRADLYSLGLVLYECLAGRVPFLGQNDADTALARLQRDPTDITRLRPTLPPGLAELVHRLLARRPDQRYPSGAALKVALADVAARVNERVPGDVTEPDTRPTLIDPTLRKPFDQAATHPMSNHQPVRPVPMQVGNYHPVAPNNTERAPGRTASRPDRDRTPTGSAAVQRRPNRKFEQRRGPSLIVVGGLLLTATVVSAILWNSLGTTSDEPFPEPGSATTVAPTEPSVASAAPPIVPSGSALPPGQTSIAAIAAYDPDGDDGQENNGDAALAIDGDVNTGWSTDCYSSQFLGGKTGVGLVTTLAIPSAGQLTVDIAGGPWQLEIRATTGVGIPATFAEWGEPIASDNSAEPEVYTLQVTSPATHLLVMLRELGPSSACSDQNPYRGTIAEVQFDPLS